MSYELNNKVPLLTDTIVAVTVAAREAGADYVGVTGAYAGGGRGHWGLARPMAA